MARFLITMHMPTANPNHRGHQITADHPAETLDEFCEELNSNAFLIVRQYYYVTDRRGSGPLGWQDRGDLIINTDHVGKVALFYGTGENVNSQ